LGTAPPALLGIYGPQAPLKTGVARYIQQSLIPLQDHFSCRHVADHEVISPYDFDHVLYHIGNNSMHHGAFRALRQRPGPVLLHEYNNLKYYQQAWHQLTDHERRQLLMLLSSALSWNTGALTKLEEFFKHYPEQDLGRIDAGCERLVIESATIVFVHSAGTARILRSRYPGSYIEVLPFPVSRIAPTCRAIGRRRLGIPDDTYLFGALGFISKRKRVESIISAWDRWKHRPSNVMLLFAGERLYNAAIPQSSQIHESGYTTDKDFDDFLLAIDCGLQLRYPCLGETSGPGSALVAHYRPVILSDIPEMQLPVRRDNVIYVPVGAGEVDALTQAMQSQYNAPKSAVGYDESFSWEAWAAVLADKMLTAPKAGTLGRESGS
jgi:glycosyltransferase involved in cell wall biosynthesis